MSLEIPDPIVTIVFPKKFVGMAEYRWVARVRVRYVIPDANVESLR